MFKTLSSKKGFTLVELLIVIVIIGILAVTVGSKFTKAPELARNAARISALQGLASALDTYFGVNNSAPGTNSTAECMNVVTNGTSGALLVSGQYMPVLPKDPSTSAPDSGACSSVAGGYGYMPLASAKGEYVVVSGVEGTVDLSKQGYTCWDTIKTATSVSTAITAGEGSDSACTGAKIYYIAR